MLVYKDTQIKFSTLGERAGVIGACLLARSKALRILLIRIFCDTDAPAFMQSGGVSVMRGAECVPIPIL